MIRALLPIIASGVEVALDKVAPKMPLQIPGNGKRKRKWGPLAGASAAIALILIALGASPQDVSAVLAIIDAIGAE